MYRNIWLRAGNTVVRPENQVMDGAVASDLYLSVAFGNGKTADASLRSR